ncbi:electron transfer flavoprotein subunit beta [Ancylobacter dichloromethanicus]|uniref:Electron transfer flavoprotein alpha/beta-subunit N-terminal domain-containing protein n=1 Tax=Ancylobacter dichloromethanicus TaxID=518825 RepID=A0A9W6J6X3_9HYPH|nr:electron transfer flavoprotein subunit beta [Ancylobacter dichloromethanicus]MBS7555332.1 electron transfer flavoprotein subunit beta [Ancylobacter dichloromethanicus]GLK70514.1 hypothetical protein GCM10017643_06290 [Ancylobacter dichloromethanicus]
MRIAVLLSAGRHPVSGRPAPVPVELQALGLALGLSDEVTGLHAGPDIGPLRDALGHGLPRLIHLASEAEDDPVPGLAAALASGGFDLVLAGRAGQGGEDSGLLPYALARALGLPIVADAVALAPGAAPGTLIVEQALARGARRRLVIRLPAVVTVHPAAPAPAPFAFAAARRGIVDVQAGPSAAEPARPASEERPYRPRPKLIARAGAGASAAERLKAATESASGGGRLLVAPSPEEAAGEILQHLRALGLLPGR